MKIHSRILHAMPYVGMLLLFSLLFYVFNFSVFSFLWIGFSFLAAIHIGTKKIEAKEESIVTSTWFGMQSMPYQNIRKVRLLPHIYRASSTHYLVIEGDDGSTMELNMWWYQWPDIGKLLLHIQTKSPDIELNSYALDLALNGQSPLEKEGKNRWRRDMLYRSGIFLTFVILMGAGYCFLV